MEHDLIRKAGRADDAEILTLFHHISLGDTDGAEVRINTLETPAVVDDDRFTGDGLLAGKDNLARICCIGRRRRSDDEINSVVAVLSAGRSQRTPYAVAGLDRIEVGIDA